MDTAIVNMLDGRTDLSVVKRKLRVSAASGEQRSRDHQDFDGLYRKAHSNNAIRTAEKNDTLTTTQHYNS